MTNGCDRLSNCAASTMYMKIEARPNASIMFVVVSSRIFTWPENACCSPAACRASSMISLRCAAALRPASVRAATLP